MEPAKDIVTPDYIRSLTQPPESLLCLLKDNQIMRFGKLRIKNLDTD